MAKDGLNEITREGYEKLKAELEEMQTIQRPEIVESIKVAREFGDIKENAEYHAAKEAQGLLESRIIRLEGRLREVKVIDGTPARSGAGIGDLVTYTVNGNSSTYELVNSLESQLDEGKLSAAAPIGQALMGSSAGDVVTACLPSGKRRKLTVTKVA